jgi:hypothetical protein
MGGALTRSPTSLLTLLIAHFKHPNHPHLNGLYPVMQQLLDS